MTHFRVQIQHEPLQSSVKGKALSSFLEVEGKQMEQSSSYCWLIDGFCLRDLQKDSDLADTIMNCSPPSETSPLFENQAVSDGALNIERFLFLSLCFLHFYCVYELPKVLF